MKLRSIEPGDRPHLEDLLQRIPQFTPDEAAVALELVDAALTDPQSGYLATVAYEDELLGYICYGPTPMTAATWDLYWVAVSPTAQGRGIGRALHDAFITVMRARGGRHVRIETSSQESYAATGGFYERLGYEMAGRLREFYADDDDLLIFYRSFG